jgi:hypothetical protein
VPDSWLDLLFAADPSPRAPGEEPRRLVKVRADTLSRHPSGVASAVVTCLLDLGYEELAETQRPAWLVATYDRLVVNDGHREYFKSAGVARASEARSVLAHLGACEQQALLDEAIRRHMAAGGETSFVVDPRRDSRPVAVDYDDLDAAYRALSPRTGRVLEAHLLRHVMHFVEVE